ncbi:unsaturated rhamnogalacturonyl hydrolase [Arthrobacter subterraneus]|uniref:Unsaturated rhamnogalacturonyl hydrolase n=1 Tax=Arthrobacter subterraneus TaxID=335973 RepID=A0A1G8K969_9MICC|nr:glycoside hydrolase family 88 protein [Arthrobacter subterraneus]SDI39933.1 unsaturated rhamnogalacturonyl hydrolase [Arthrobacter subterraneus]
MAGEDTTSAELSAPPLKPLSREKLIANLGGLENSLISGTEGLGIKRWFWGEGVCLLALGRGAVARGTETPELITSFTSSFIDSPPVLEHVNNLAPGAAIAELHRRAPSPATEELLEACVRWYKVAPEATRAPNGALEHWPGGVWADTVYMAGEFLLRAGITLERPELVQESVNQWIAHAELLQDDATGLFVHGTHGGARIDNFWGRANAWTSLAAADLLALAPAADGIAEVRERLQQQLNALAALQPEHGVWDVLVDGQLEVRGVLETSAAAGIGAAMLRTDALLQGTSQGQSSSTLRQAGERAIRGALAYVEDGVLTRVSAGTVLQLIPFGYSVIRDDRIQPWGQGLALEAIAAWRETTKNTNP